MKNYSAKVSNKAPNNLPFMTGRIHPYCHAGKTQSAVKWFEAVRAGASPSGYGTMLGAAAAMWSRANTKPKGNPLRAHRHTAPIHTHTPHPHTRNAHTQKDKESARHWQHLCMNYWLHIDTNKLSEQVRILCSLSLSLLCEKIIFELYRLASNRCLFLWRR